MAGNGKVQYRVKVSVQNTRNYHKLIIPETALGEAIRWKQALYVPGQKTGKGLRKFREAEISIVLK